MMMQVIFQAVVVFIALPSVNMLITIWCAAVAAVVLWYAVVIARRKVCVCLDHPDLALVGLGLLPIAFFRLSLYWNSNYTLAVVNSRVSLAWFLLIVSVLIIRHGLILSSLPRHNDG